MTTVPAFAGTVVLHLEDATPYARQHWPITAGVPLPEGSIKSAANLRLFDAAGNPIPLQAEVSMRWEDGSVKWVLCDFAADVQPQQTVDYQLQYDNTLHTPQPTGIVTTQTADSITVNTGKLRMTLSKNQWDFPGKVQVLNDAHQLQSVTASGDAFTDLVHQSPGEPQEENWLRDAPNNFARDRYEAGGDQQYKLTVENDGALRTTLRLEAWQVNTKGQRFAPITLRVTLFANSTLIKALHTFVYTGNAQEDFIRSMAVSLPLTGKNIKSTFGAQAGTSQEINLSNINSSASLDSIGPDRFYNNVPYTADKTVNYQITNAGKVLSSGKEAPGWMQIKSDSAALTLAARDFWQQAPQQLEVKGNGVVTYYQWPEAGSKVLDLRRRYKGIDNEHHYDLSEWPYDGLGVAKSHEFWMDFGTKSTFDGKTLSAFIDTPLYAMPDPLAVQQSNVFGPFAVRDSKRFPRLEAWQDFAINWIRANQKAFHWDGMLDYGDTLFWGYGTSAHGIDVTPNSWLSRGYTGWLNSDGGLPHSLFLQALRSGNRETMQLADIMTRHSMDVDVCHYCPPNPAAVGGGHRHDQQHWGNDVRGYGTATHGVIDYYLLFGDNRAKDVALETANWHLNPSGGEPGEGAEDEDQIGGLLRAWEITGDKKYFDGAMKFLSRELDNPSKDPQTTPYKNWSFFTAPHFRFVSNTSTNLIFAQSILAGTPQGEKVDNALVQAADSLKPVYLAGWNSGTYHPEIVTALGYLQSRDPQLLDVGKSQLKRLNIPADLDAQKYWPQGLQMMPFPEMAKLSSQLQINNIYILTIFGLCSMPYLQKAFLEGNVASDQIDKPIFLDIKADPFEEILDNKRISHGLGFEYEYSLSHASPSDQYGGTSTLELYENGKLLAPAHSPHKDIREQGNGRWSHWGSQHVHFSASDNSDPRTNGRTYKVVQK